MRITPQNVINRLRTLGALGETIDTNILNDISYIPAAEADVDDLMDLNAIVYADLSASRKILVQSLEVLLVCKTCITPALEENLQSTGITKDKATMYQERMIALKAFNDEITRLKKRLGLTKIAQTSA